MIRRSFITSILALSAAPAIVRADSLMRMVSRETVMPSFIGVPQNLSIMLSGSAFLYDGLLDPMHLRDFPCVLVSARHGRSVCLKTTIAEGRVFVSGLIFVDLRAIKNLVDAGHNNATLFEEYPEFINEMNVQITIDRCPILQSARQLGQSSLVQ